MAVDFKTTRPLTDWQRKDAPLLAEHGIYLPNAVDFAQRDREEERHGRGAGFGACLCCGRKVKPETRHEVQCHGGAPDVFVPFGAPAAIEDEPGYMGVYDLGPACAKRMIKALNAAGRDGTRFVRKASGDARRDPLDVERTEHELPTDAFKAVR